jgi:protein-disulfide isomerase
MSSHLKPPVGEKDHVQGVASAAIELVEYGDYQCPHCGAAHPVIKKIQKTFGKQVRFVFRNFPLQESHPYAMPAAIAAEAANLQGKFWEMHDAIYENQAALSDDGLSEMAKEIGLDMDQFENDIQNKKVREKVETDFESGMRSGVNGTPAFYINGNKFDGGAEDVFDVLKESAA